MTASHAGKALYTARRGLKEGFGKGNRVALSSVAEVWNPLRNGFQVFVTFSIKSKGERLCFAEKVPNGRTSNVVKETSLTRPRPTSRYSTKRPFSGLFSINHTSPSGSHKKYAPAWRYTPSDNLRP